MQWVLFVCLTLLLVSLGRASEETLPWWVPASLWGTCGENVCEELASLEENHYVAARLSGVFNNPCLCTECMLHGANYTTDRSEETSCQLSAGVALLLLWVISVITLVVNTLMVHRPHSEKELFVSTIVHITIVLGGWGVGLIMKFSLNSPMIVGFALSFCHLTWLLNNKLPPKHPHSRGIVLTVRQTIAVTWLIITYPGMLDRFRTLLCEAGTMLLHVGVMVYVYQIRFDTEDNSMRVISTISSLMVIGLFSLIVPFGYADTLAINVLSLFIVLLLFIPLAVDRLNLLGK